jgi:hypothetical protein
VKDIDRLTNDLVGSARQQMLQTAKSAKGCRVHVPDDRLAIGQDDSHRDIFDYLGEGAQLDAGVKHRMGIRAR